MLFVPWVWVRTALAGATLVVGVGVGFALISGGAGAADKPASSPSRATAITAPLAGKAKANPNLYPFGAPSGNGEFAVPPPPESPTLVPTIATKIPASR
jgi:hypothetical protein